MKKRTRRLKPGEPDYATAIWKLLNIVHDLATENDPQLSTIRYFLTQDEKLAAFFKQMGSDLGT